MDYPETLNGEIVFQDFGGLQHVFIAGMRMCVGQGKHPEPYIFIAETEELITNFSSEEQLREVLEAVIARVY